MSNRHSREPSNVPYLRTFLANAGLRQQDIADRLGINSSNVGLWVNGQRPVPDVRLEALAEVLQITVAELTHGAPLPAGREHSLPVGECWNRSVRPVPVMRVVRTLEFAQWRAQSPLEQAGLVRDPDVHPVYETYCFLCGRGTGPNGVLRPTFACPEHPNDCRYCGGAMFVRRIESDREIERAMRSDYAEVAA